MEHLTKLLPKTEKSLFGDLGVKSGFFFDGGLATAEEASSPVAGHQHACASLPD